MGEIREALLRDDCFLLAARVGRGLIGFRPFGVALVLALRRPLRRPFPLLLPPKVDVYQRFPSNAVAP